MRPRPADEAGIAAAVDALARGLLVLHPTETVVSLSGDPRDEGAVEAARAIKGYAEARPFLCLVPDVASARRLARAWPAVADALAAAWWPGPLTLVVRAGEEAPAAVAAGGTIALRPAADPVSTDLLAAWGRPLFSTSANLRGRTPPVAVEDAVDGLIGAPRADAVAVALLPLAPAAPVGRPSTIVDVGVAPPRLVREGAVPAERLREVMPGLVRAEA